VRCFVIVERFRQAQVFVSDSYGRSRRQFGISGLHGGGRVASNSVRPVRFAAVRAEGSSGNDSRFHNSALVRRALLMSVIGGGAW
jgi:hypothetical protein